MTHAKDSGFECSCPFPALFLYEDSLAVYEHCDAFTTCGMADVRAGKRGRFAPCILIDAFGRSWRICGANVLHGVGPFWGWNLFLNRSVRVNPIVTDGPDSTDVEILRREVVSRILHRNCFSIEVHRFVTTIGRAAAGRIVPSIKVATSSSEIISILLSADFTERKRAAAATNNA